MTREVRSGFNRGLGAVGTLTVCLAAGVEGSGAVCKCERVCVCVWVEGVELNPSEEQQWEE